MSEVLPLDELDLHLTDRCNAQCVHCSYEATAAGPSRDLSVSLALDLIKQAARASCAELHLTGGEALLHPDVFTIAATGKSHEMTVRLQTNGRAISDRIASRIQDTGIDWVMISVDGSQSSINDGIRGPGSFAAAVGAAKALHGKVRLRLNSVIMAENVNDVVPLFELGRRLNVDLHSFFYFLPIGRGKTLRQRVVEPDHWRRAYDELLSAIARSGSTVPSVVFEPCFAPNGQSAPPVNCKALLGRYVSVNPGGTFSLCLITESVGPEFLLDARRHQLDDRTILVDRIKRLDATACADCTEHRSCAGRCPAHSAFTGRPHGELDPRCGHPSLRPVCPFYKLHVATGQLGASTSQADTSGRDRRTSGMHRTPQSAGSGHGTSSPDGPAVQDSDDASATSETNAAPHPLTGGADRAG